MKLLIASQNIHKVREFRSLLKKLSFLDVYSLRDFPDYHPLPEVGATFEENATSKAVHAAQALGMVSLADDSGLIVPALNGEPGVYSARYAGPKARDEENRQKLLRAMQGMHGHQRNAYFECCIVIAHPEGKKRVFKGVCEGVIISQEQGQGGFGYDPIFMKHDYNKTFAELSEETKNRISHRGRALDKALLYLETLSVREGL